jgi:hypothetical protein
MRRTIPRLAMLLACLPLAAMGCDKGNAPNAGAAPEASPTGTAAPADTAAAAPTMAPTQAAEAMPAATSTAAAAPSGTGTAAAAPADTSAATAPASTGTSAAATPAPSGSAAAGPKTFDCGAKGQKACPMQGWMKSAMAAAASSGDGEKLSKALAYVAGKSPPGMGSWASISSAGAAKAKAGDIDGAKTSCKQCHDLYKEKYKNTMRDRPW